MSFDYIKQKVAIVGGSKLSHNEVTILLNLGRMLGGKWDLNLVTCDKVPEKICKQYTVHSLLHNKYDIHDFRYGIGAAFYTVRKIEPVFMMNISKDANIGLCVALIGKKYSVPTLIRMTGNSYQEHLPFSNPFKRFKKWLFHTGGAGIAYKISTKVLTLGEGLKSELIAHGISEDKIIVQPQPFDKGRFFPVEIGHKMEIRKKFGLSLDKRIILFVGRVSYLKGADRLEEIISKVSSVSLDYQFCIVGDGELTGRFEKYEGSCVKHFSSISNEHIAEVYQAADLLVYPTRMDGVPNVILESISCRLPVVATPIAEIPRYTKNIKENVQGFIDFILEKNWPVDPFPEGLNWDDQVDKYNEIFEQFSQYS